MKQSNEINELAQALAIAQTCMPSAKMTGINARFADARTGKTGAYATLDDIRTAVSDHLTSNGISYTQHPYAIRGEVGVETMLIHKSGQWIRSRFGVPATQHNPQAYGSILTYARKFGLAAACGLSTEEDTDAAEVSKPEESVETVSAKQIGILQNLLAEKGLQESRILKWKSINNLTELKQADFEIACENIKKAKKSDKRD